MAGVVNSRRGRRADRVTWPDLGRPAKLPNNTNATYYCHYYYYYYYFNFYC